MTRRYYDEGELAVSATGDVAAFYAEDHLGSIRDLRMGDGQVQASYDYDPYGAPTRTDETGGVHADYRYAGLVHHAPSGLYLAHYRAYSAADGRWMSRDPIGEAGGVNLYAYVGGSPLNYSDPMGLAANSSPSCTCPPIPPAPSGASCPNNIEEAQQHSDPRWFRDQVRNGGPWDYKQQGRQYENFGNFNYGATGRSFGFPSSILLRAAGRAQERAGTSDPKWGRWYGRAPYGDDPVDQANIQNGIQYYECECYK